MSGLNAAATLSMKIDTGSATKELLALHTAYTNLRGELSKGMGASGGFNTLSAELAKTRNELGKLQAALGMTQGSYTTLESKAVESARMMSGAHHSVAAATHKATVAQQAWNTAALDGHALARGLSGSLGTLWMTYGRLVPLMAGAALGAGFTKAAKGISEFSYQLEFVKQLGDNGVETDEAINRLKESAMSLGQSGLYSPLEIADGYRVLAQAGLDAAQALKVMPDALNLATVGEMSMESAAISLVGTMNAFNLTVEDSSHISDVFAKAAALSQTSVEAMTQSMRLASVVGEQYGASMEDTATALTVLAKLNITGSMAGTSFRNMLKELYAPKGPAVGTLKQLGIAAGDAQGNLRSFVDIIYDLKGKIQEYDKISQTNILQKIFGERGGKEAVAMLSMTREEWNKLRSSIDDEGFAQRVTDELAKTLHGRWKQAMGALEASLIASGDHVQGRLKEIATSMKHVFQGDDFNDGLRTIVSGMTGLASMLTKVSPMLITLGQAFVAYKAGAIAAALATTGLSAAGRLLGATTALASGGLVTYTQNLRAVAAGTMAVSVSSATGAMSLHAVATGARAAAAGTNAAAVGVTGLRGALMLLGGPFSIIAGLVAAGISLWMMWGDNGEREARRVAAAVEGIRASLSRLNDLSDRISMGDMGQVAGAKALRAELMEVNKEADEFAKRTESGGVRIRVKQMDTRRFSALSKEDQIALMESSKLERRLSEEDQTKLAGIREKYARIKTVAADLAKAGEKEQNAYFDESRYGKKQWVADDPRTRLGKDWETDAEKREIERVKAVQQKEIQLLESKNSNKLISEEQYQHDLLAIYAKYEPEIEKLYRESAARLGELAAKTQGDEKERAKAAHQKMLDDREKYHAEKELREARHSDRLEGQIKAAQDRARKATEKAQASALEYIERMHDARAKLSMTPESSAAYDAYNKIGHIFKDDIAKQEATLKNLLAVPGITKANTQYQAQLAILKDLKDAREDLAVAAAKHAAEEAAAARSLAAGWEASWKKYAEDATNSAKYAESVFNMTTKSMEDALTQFIQKGVVDWQSLTNAVFVELAKMEARWLLSKLFGKHDERQSPGGEALTSLFNWISGKPGESEKKGTEAAKKAAETGVGIAKQTSDAVAMTAFNAGITTASASLTALAAAASAAAGAMGASGAAANMGLLSATNAADQAGGALAKVAEASGATSGGLMEMLSGFSDGLGSLLNSLFSLLGGGGGGGGGDMSGMVSAAASLMSMFFAKGGGFGQSGVYAFANGSAFGSNQILNQATPFMFANGAGFSLGVAGEAGDEAVMPLRRDSQGRLGVIAQQAEERAQPMGVATPAPQTNLRIINAFDTGVVGNYMGSAAGEKIIMNVVKKNQATVKQMSRS